MLSRLRIHETDNELKLHLNDEFKNQYIFRKCEKTSLGYAMSPAPITQGMMGGWVKRIDRLLGFGGNTICYNLRYMTDNGLDQSGT